MQRQEMHSCDAIQSPSELDNTQSTAKYRRPHLIQHHDFHLLEESSCVRSIGAFGELLNGWHSVSKLLIFSRDKNAAHRHQVQVRLGHVGSREDAVEAAVPQSMARRM